jgi:hypothetical protein
MQNDKGIRISIISMSFEFNIFNFNYENFKDLFKYETFPNLFIIRPRGVISNHDIGERKTLFNIA